MSKFSSNTLKSGISKTPDLLALPKGQSNTSQSAYLSFKGIPFSTTAALEQPKAENQGEVLARLDLNEKIKAFEILVRQMETRR